MTLNASRASVPWQIEQIESPVDGIQIRYGTHATGLNKPSCGLLFLNGRSEWLEKYSDLPLELDLGDDVLWVSLDHRGQGGSEGLRAHVDDYEHFARDAAAVAERCFGDLPFCVVTHSMGGLIALVAMTRGLLRAQAAVLCSPLLALPNEPLRRSLARPIARFVSRGRFQRQSTGFRSKRDANFHSNALTSSFQGFQKVLSSPYPFVGPTFGWVHATFDACERVFAPENLKLIPCPIKIIYGGEERVVDASVYASWCEQFHRHSSFAVELLRVPDARHELLNEIPRLKQQALRAIKDWLLKYRRG